MRGLQDYHVPSDRVDADRAVKFGWANPVLVAYDPISETFPVPIVGAKVTESARACNYHSRMTVSDAHKSYASSYHSSQQVQQLCNF